MLCVTLLFIIIIIIIIIITTIIVITFSNSLDPGQAQQHALPDLKLFEHYCDYERKKNS